MAQINLIQWNCQSLHPKKHELLSLINLHNPVIIAISETWFVPGSRFRCPGFACFRDDRNDGYAGSAILIRHSIPFSHIPLPSLSSSINAVAIRAFNVSFLSIYIPHPRTCLGPELRSIISSLPSPILVMGDFNTHHTMWGSHFCDGFAPVLVYIIDDVNLCVLNDGSPTRRVLPHQNSKSVVDLSLSSASISSLISWKVLSSSYGSDHFPILLSITQSPPPRITPNPSLKQYKLRDPDWHAYATSVDNILDSLPSFVDDENILICYNKFYNAIISSANICFEKIKLQKKIVHL